MKKYFRVYEVHNNERIYFNAEFEPCDRKEAYLFSKEENWMDDRDGVYIEWCGEDENMRLNGQEELFKL